MLNFLIACGSEPRLSQDEVKKTAPTESLILRRLGQKIHSHLHERNRSVDWLALQSDVARSTLREILAGRTNPRLLTVHSIAKGLGYSSVGEFLGSQRDDE